MQEASEDVDVVEISTIKFASRGNYPQYSCDLYRWLVRRGHPTPTTLILPLLSYRFYPTALILPLLSYCFYPTALTLPL